MKTTRTRKAPVPPQPPDQDDLAARKTHLRTMAVAGALATVGAFAGLAASTDPTTVQTNPNGGFPPSTPGQGAQSPNPAGSGSVAPPSPGTNGSGGDITPQAPDTSDGGSDDDGFVSPTTPSTGQDGFTDPQGGFFGPGGGQSVAPSQGSGGSGGPPAMSGGS